MFKIPNYSFSDIKKKLREIIREQERNFYIYHTVERVQPFNKAEYVSIRNLKTCKEYDALCHKAVLYGADKSFLEIKEDDGIKIKITAKGSEFADKWYRRILRKHESAMFSGIFGLLGVLIGYLLTLMIK